MPKNVRKIPASVNLYNAVPITNKKKRKVAAYARVSTDQEELRANSISIKYLILFLISIYP